MKDLNVLSQKRRDLFRRLLPALWLRPERALWDAHELAIVDEMLGDRFDGPSLEYGCTEGTNTFVMLGGEFGLSYDDYRELSASAGKPASGDVFDTGKRATPLAAGDIVRPGRAQFDLGVSWREAHLAKSERLGVYRKLELAELNQPLSSQADGSFRLIWSPNLFWSEADALERMLRDHCRLLAPGGRIVTILPDSSQKGCLFYPELRKIAPDVRWVDQLDRGVTENTIRHARSRAEWDEFFGKNGLEITRAESFLPAIVSRVYQVGFRPFFPALMKMYESLGKAGPGAVADVKEHWIETAFHFLSPLCDGEWMAAGSADTWHAFELRAKGGA